MAEPRNAASDQVRVMFPLLGNRAFVESESALELFTDDFVREDRRRLVSMPDADARAFLDQVATWFELGGDTPSFTVSEVIATRGERCALVRCRVDIGDDGSEFLSAFALDEQQRTRRSVLFDPDQIDTALTELDRLDSTNTT